MSKTTRLWKVRLHADRKTWEENEELHGFKRKYDEYIQPVKLLTEKQLLVQIAAGMVIEASIQGEIEND